MHNKIIILKTKIFLVKFRRLLGVDIIMRLINDYYEKINNPDAIGAKTKKIDNGWSIVITTGGQAPDYLLKLISSAERELSGTPHEVIVVGPKNLNIQIKPQSNIRHLIYRELRWSPGWITRKKNLGVASTRFDKIVVCHDYVHFLPGWKKGFDKFGENFDVCMNIILNNDGSRFRDWITWDYPNIGVGLLPYHAECTPYQIISGTYFVAKRNFYLNNPLNEKLRWGEGEDVEWSRRIRKITKFKLNTYSKTGLLKQKKESPANWIEGTNKLEKIYR
ncbi:hypothetical protein A2303_04695 [Candidatus Falkowbacteria bacterium RIFOXYB2_FULL_47_14]|uniref:Glycosyltransferase 2-like domain-containing protein n=1 Tax=Candidatus Falkowbacteria bacterium RIFOXYA2_FULL_47_19 TaxID=1797994 RepID=A0A1F5SH98_9BACT|nr:MAG: hypothetical protein A2227_02530 [Candidatus Falkowbacteria bacterium RIFOXYA2_FULL_47_19]OGF35800.1 MAG: hypothetical protein A2468_03715 [Candidatus Falkowbacteria bacterium RIFOXYC2_FULL_46_15]OGF42673.1 MAG: hypothetical protein A2303_04695 [Candidatus Falkowbacteria bacterium RIFOXYB2_FULL_47_14]